MKKTDWDDLFKRLTEKRFGQDFIEYRLFIEYVGQFFLMRKIFNPLVVEIGTRRNRQKQFYEEFLNATHIGIDISDRYGTPDILGDSHDKKTYDELFKKIWSVSPDKKFRHINLLFIDGDHSFDGVKDDYFMYSPLVKRGIVAVHDIACERKDVDVPLFWSNIIKSDHRYPYMTIFNWRDKDRMGIGLQVRDK